MYLIFKIAIKIVDLKQTTRYFSSKYGHIWEHQRIIIWGLQPWWPTYRPSGSSAEGEHFIKEGEEAERPVVNNVSLAFHPLSLAETEEDSLLPVGLCCHCKPWELPLLVSSLFNWRFCLSIFHRFSSYNAFFPLSAKRDISWM